MDVRPLAPALGAEVTSIDLTAVGRETFEAILDVWSRYLVLVLPRQRLTDEELAAFSRHFGQLDMAPPVEATRVDGYSGSRLPEVTVISNVVANGKPIGALGAGEAEWHTDMSYHDVPPSASLLYALEIPPAGGDTSFCSMYAAYDTLPADLLRSIRDRIAIHDITYTSAGDLRKGITPVQDVTQTPGARHPLVRIHPLTKRKALFLGRRRNGYIVGLPVPESEALLDRLWAHATQERFVFTHRWSVGDIVIWDNRCVMHRREAFDPQSRRIMHRTQVKGEVPVAAAA
ncbi:MAG TPA: TauD/TfdA family dioxygenase [Casimicrobiaceae bacterium]|jgi:taurine dioxygenase|nr:TauD/TfdA family dioxygenase [Casimicrobiaceae bacterium]